jgi:hypothetical protein
MELLNSVGCRYSDLYSKVDLDSVVGTATGRGLDVSGRDFPHLSIQALGPIQVPVEWESVILLKGKVTGSGVDHLLAPSLKKG